MNNIETSTISLSTQTRIDDHALELSFNDKVLHYFQQHQPDGDLNDILDQLRALSPDKPVTMQQLYTALMSADGRMRKDADYQGYTQSTLDGLTIRMIGVTMFYNNMLNKGFSSSNETESL